MIGAFPMSSTPLDDFLSGAGESVAFGQRLEQIGLIGSICGLLLAAGMLGFLAVVHRGPAREVGILIRLIGAAGVLALIGAVVEVAGAASVLGASWFVALGETSAPMIRLLAGLLIAFGLSPDIESAHLHRSRDSSDGDMRPSGESGPTAVNEPATVRWIPSAASAFGLAGAAVGLLSFGFDGHTVSKGPRAIHAAVNLVHVTAGSVWFGGIVGLTAVAFMRRHSPTAVGPLVVRFSSVATVALVAVSLAGVLMSIMIIDRFADFTGTPWGRILLVKVGAVAVAVTVGAYNHFVVVPAIERDPDDRATATLVRRTMTAEAAVLVFVAIVTVLLTTASTN